MAKVQRWAALGVAAVLAVLALGWVLLVGPQRSAAAELRATAEQQRQANARARTALSVLEAQARDLPEQRARLQKIMTQIPADPAQPALVRLLRDASSQAGVELLSLEPGAAAAATAAAPGSSSTAPALQVLPLTTRVSGSYFDVEQYVALLEKAPRALRVISVQVEPGEDPVGGRRQTAGTPLVATVTAEAFVAQLGEAAPAAGSTPGSTPAVPSPGGSTADPS